MKQAVLVGLIVGFYLTIGCSPEWASCPTCDTDLAKPTADAIVVNVDNDVTVDVDVNNCVQVAEVDDTCACTFDAGTPPPPPQHDAGTPPAPDAGVPPGCTCKKVCKEYQRIHTGHTSHTCHDRSKDKLVCARTVLECKKDGK